MINNNAFDLLQGEFPLTPRSSCCLTPLTSLTATLPHLTYGESVTANATTGLEITLLLGLGALTWRTIRQMIATVNQQTLNSNQESLEILEQLLSRKSSLFSITEEFFKELAIHSGHPLQQVKAETAYNTAIVLLTFSQFKQMTSSIETNLELELQKHLRFYQEFGKSIIPRLPLVEPETQIAIEKFLKEMQQLSKTYPRFNYFTRKGVKWLALFDEKYQKLLRCEKLFSLLKIEIDKLLEQLQQVSLINYPWQETSLKELKKQTESIIDQFIEISPKKERQEFLEAYRKNYLEYLEEIGITDDDYDWDNLESYWIEEEPKIIEAAKKMLKEKQEILPEGKKLKEHYQKLKREEDYYFLIKQSYLFYKNLPMLIKNYAGLYVWFEDEEVKDFDLNRTVLCSRVIRSSEIKTRNLQAIYTHQVPKIN